MRVRFYMTTALLAAILVPCTAMSQISGPIMGFVFQPGTGIRPVLGIPGSSLMGEALRVDAHFSSVVFSPRHDYALGTTWKEPALLLIDLRTDPAATRPVSEVSEIPDRIVMSYTGSVAVLIYSAGQRMDVLAGFPDSPRVRDSLDVSSLPEPPTAIAVSDDGEAVLAAFADGDYGALYLLQKGGPRFVTRLGRISALSFEKASHDAFVADQLNNEIILLRNLWGERIVLAGEKDGLLRPDAIAISADGNRVFVTNADAGTLLAIDTTGESPNLLQCGCKLSGVHALNDNSVFRLTEWGSDPILILDAAGNEPQIHFIPAVPN